MTIPAREAADTLQDIERAQRRSVSAYRDRMASPHLILWGVIWVIGYAATYAWPNGWYVWLALVPAGMFAGWWIGRRYAGAKSRSHGLRYTATAVAVFLFLAALFTIQPPKSGLQIGALLPILIAFWYLLQGIWTRTARIAVVGLCLGALTIGGYLWLQPYFPLWMAGVGGGALILGGFWMRGI